ncbi:probable tRNA N6-adenosine threonylcarbamoyltransferase, mitochondrial [Rhinatrema bivittatum]|uniref:probable tRNA N6-adenosine threonylcarbamoyltransferase, mitochondrial n=1 Tax=Rhinatrema bivittatum TaxID=194408 RepID=UPI00112E5CA6|nr:probable tRNA N6-adenosine threonylcarbamoyltransferase, mitochondrial [Rhinatrema bivittatum]
MAMCKALGRFYTSEGHNASWAAQRGKILFHSGMCALSRVVLGIETSCDDTGAAVVDETGHVLGEALRSQTEVHLKTGGIIPTVAQQLHRESIAGVVHDALRASGISPNDLAAIATTVKPGLALSLGVGLAYSVQMVKQYQKPFIPIHHMEAHALTVRLMEPVDFPFLVLLISGGHCMLLVARGVCDFLLLGQSLDEAPGDTLDKAARRLYLAKHPECAAMSGGQAIEHIAQRGNRLHCEELRMPMTHSLDCNFSFAGLRTHVNRLILQKEKEEGLQEGQVLTCVADIAAAVQHMVTLHVAKRTHRAILFCKKEGLLPQKNACLVVSGGVASNQYIRRALRTVTDATEFTLLCPPPRLCTDNGIMIAWNGIERLCAGLQVLHTAEGVRYEPKAPLGTDISDQVRQAAIKVPRLKLNPEVK